MRLLLVATIAVGSLRAAAPVQQFSPHFPDLNSQDVPRALAADASGDFFIVSTSAKTPTSTNIHVTKTDSAGNAIAVFDFGGSGVDTPEAATVDSQGNLIIAGGTTSADFPLASALQSSGSIFVTRIDGQLQGILFSTLLGGATGSFASAVAVDPEADIYVTGVVSVGSTPAFTTTPGAFQPSPPVAQEAANGIVVVNQSGFIAEISATNQLLFSTYFGGGAVTIDGSLPCVPLFLCLTANVFTAPAAIAVDSAGAIVVAGNTDSSNLPVTADAFLQQCNCTDDSAAAFAAKLAPGGSQLVWGSYIALPSGAAANMATVTITAMALDSGGNVILAGDSLQGLPVTANAVEAAYPTSTALAAGFVAKLDASGSKLLFATYFGDDEETSTSNGPVATAVDAAGTIWLAGSSAPSAMPTPSGAPLIGTNYIAGLSPDGSSLISFFTAPNGAANSSLAVTDQGTVADLGTSGELLISSIAVAPSLMGIVELDANTVASALCGRELVSLYGFGIGPASGIVAPIADNTINRSLDGYQVLFNGVPGAILYAGPTQIDTILPSAVAAAQTVNVQIVTPSGTINGPILPVHTAAPQVYTNGPTYAFAINQDGTVNSATNRAQPGSIVSIWMTGGGAVADTPDNQINTALNPNPYPISLFSGTAGGGTVPLTVTYEGDAPEMPSGAIQVNFQLPGTSEANGFPLILQVGTQVTQFFVQAID